MFSCKIGVTNEFLRFNESVLVIVECIGGKLCAILFHVVWDDSLRLWWGAEVSVSFSVIYHISLVVQVHVKHWSIWILPLLVLNCAFSFAPIVIALWLVRGTVALMCLLFFSGLIEVDFMVINLIIFERFRCLFVVSNHCFNQFFHYDFLLLLKLFHLNLQLLLLVNQCIELWLLVISFIILFLF